MANSPYNLAGANENLSHSLPTIYAQFRLLRDELGVCRNNATQLTLEPGTGTSYILNNYNRVKTYQLQDGVPMNQAQAITDASTTVTPIENGVQVLIANTTVRRVNDPDLYGRIGRIMANSFDLKEDQDIAAQFANFTISIGAGGVVLSPGHILAASTQVSVGGNLANPEPYGDDLVGIFHPCSLAAVAARIVPLSDTPAGTTAYSPTTQTGKTVGPGRDGEGLSEEIMAQGPKAMGTLFGVKIFRDANVSLSGTDAKNSIFNPVGLLFCSEFEPYMDPDRSPKGRYTECNIIGSYGPGTYRPQATGSYMLFDATLPTS